MHRRSKTLIYSDTGGVIAIGSMGNRIKQLQPPVNNEYGLERSQLREFKTVPKTAFHLGPNKALFRGVKSKQKIVDSRCILVGQDKMVYPLRFGAGTVKFK